MIITRIAKVEVQNEVLTYVDHSTGVIGVTHTQRWALHNDTHTYSIYNFDCRIIYLLYVYMCFVLAIWTCVLHIPFNTCYILLFYSAFMATKPGQRTYYFYADTSEEMIR